MKFRVQPCKAVLPQIAFSNHNRAFWFCLRCWNKYKMFTELATVVSLNFAINGCCRGRELRENLKSVFRGKTQKPNKKQGSKTAALRNEATRMIDVF